MGSQRLRSHLPHHISLCALLVCLIVGIVPLLPPRSALGFSLLGPLAPWMHATNGYNGIGGAMNIHEGYRWNVPVVTYGFDNSFLGFFGSNGVMAVESAIQVLNDLPAASSMELTNYPPYSQRINYLAQSQHLLDLKSFALALLVEQLGLAPPVEHIFDLRARIDPSVFLPSGNSCEHNWPGWLIPNFIIERNFDPETLAATRWRNGTLHSGCVIYAGESLSYVFEYPIDPLGSESTAVADHRLDRGVYYAGLTWDDAGGLRFLYRTNTVNFEMLLPGVRGSGPNADSWTDGAWRPGVDKITFIPHSLDAPGAFLRMTNQFTDTFISNGLVMQQQLERVQDQPDFLFTAEDLGQDRPMTSWVWRTETSCWINNALLNGGFTNDGPGVIPPPIKIAFHKGGKTITTTDTGLVERGTAGGWGSFTATFPSSYPAAGQGETNHLSIRFRLYPNYYYSSHLGSFFWELPLPRDAAAWLQMSTNLLDWATVATVTNQGGIVEWQHLSTSSTRRFFRAIPEQ